jgi:hypothetical protein
MTIRPVGAEFHADGQTDMTKLIVCFHNFAEAPENELHEIASFDIGHFGGLEETSASVVILWFYLKMEAADSSELCVLICPIAWSHISYIAVLLRVSNPDCGILHCGLRVCHRAHRKMATERLKEAVLQRIHNNKATWIRPKDHSHNKQVIQSSKHRNK